jgi:IclR family transcriptional regulator, pca regulon regulatory protein
VPVTDPAGRVVAALNSSGHSKRMTKAQLVRDRLPMLRQVSREISSELALVPGLALSVQA